MILFYYRRYVCDIGIILNVLILKSESVLFVSWRWLRELLLQSFFAITVVRRPTLSRKEINYYVLKCTDLLSLCG